MQILFWVLVIYVTFDLAACAYVIYQRGGFTNVLREIRTNLGYTTDAEDEDDVHDQW